MIDHPILLAHDGQKVTYLYNIKQNPLLQERLDTAKVTKSKPIKNKLKAVLQEFSTRLHRNKLYYEY
ncbi:MAG: hypothetical protein BRD50_05140 [Bacteroidetes bacterium SW_11_45_7]|nr:MAG: hypothetical protein BRD50_05140 [Bacteroidetes bacterium SW_11_45_7]